MRCMRRIFDGVVLGKEASKAPTTDGTRRISSSKVSTQAFDIIYDLVKCIRLRMRALAVTAKIKG